MEHKSERIKTAAMMHGWNAEVVPKLDEYEKTKRVNDIEWHVYGMRDKETIHVIYIGNRFSQAKYTYGNHVQYPARSGAVLRLLAGTPDIRKLNNAKNLIETRKLPWNENAPALDVLLAVIGKRITWVRKIDNEVCTAHVEKETNLGKPYFRLTESKAGRRILEWQDREGFHAVGLDQIIAIG